VAPVTAAPVETTPPVQPTPPATPATDSGTTEATQSE